MAGEGLDGGQVGAGVEQIGDEAAAQVVRREAVHASLFARPSGLTSNTRERTLSMERARAVAREASSDDRD